MEGLFSTRKSLDEHAKGLVWENFRNFARGNLNRSEMMKKNQYYLDVKVVRFGGKSDRWKYWTFWFFFAFSRQHQKENCLWAAAQSGIFGEKKRERGKQNSSADTSLDSARAEVFYEW